MWFKTLTGFSEESPEQVRRLIYQEDAYLVSTVNHRRIKAGQLEIPDLQELRSRLPETKSDISRLSIEELVADVRNLHLDPANQGAMFQVASQFNLLEMVSPEVTPKQGVGIYEHDLTQGPACAIACGAGTIFRNYFVKIDKQIGQSADKQIDCLEQLEHEFASISPSLWTMKNGYALFSRTGLRAINAHILSSSPKEVDRLKSMLKVGIQWDTEVTISQEGHTVSQVYASALPAAYHDFPALEFEPFARLILEATYEATFCAAILNAEKTGNPNLFLTLVGGGVFGNDLSWILDALKLSLVKFSNFPLKVFLVSYGHSNPTVKDWISSWMQ